MEKFKEKLKIVWFFTFKKVEMRVGLYFSGALWI
jgi:hypothetical protein